MSCGATQSRAIDKAHDLKRFPDQRASRPASATSRQILWSVTAKFKAAILTSDNASLT